ALRLGERLDGELQAADLSRVFALEMRALPAIATMRYAGAPFDVERWRALSDAAVAEQIRLEQELTAAAGAADMLGDNTINWGSPAQVLKLLQARGHAITNTDETALRAIADREPIAALMLRYREASKRATTYGIEWAAKHVHPGTGRIHANFISI